MGTNLGLYGLKLGSSILTRRGDHDPTTPEGPRPLVLLKLHLRFFGVFFNFWSQQIRKMVPGLALAPALAPALALALVLALALALALTRHARRH